MIKQIYELGQDFSKYIEKRWYRTDGPNVLEQEITGYRPEQTIPDLTVDGDSVDLLLEEAKERDRQERILVEAQDSSVRHITRTVTHQTGGGVGSSLGIAGWAILGAGVGSALSFAATGSEHLLPEVEPYTQPILTKTGIFLEPYGQRGLEVLKEIVPNPGTISAWVMPIIADGLIYLGMEVASDIKDNVAGIGTAIGVYHGLRKTQRPAETLSLRVSVPLTRARHALAKIPSGIKNRLVA
jgi:hypothetical protein